MELLRHLILPFVLFPSLAYADFSSPVVSVLDGDTIEVLHNTHPERIRLSGIDCPGDTPHLLHTKLAPP